MIQTPSCACDLFIHPAVIENVPGLDELRYRAGDFSSFRRALLLSRAGEGALDGWRPGGAGDLAVQLVEWWAVLADILTFYNERIVQESYLRTADFPESVINLVRLLGYRPRPGIGATGTVAVLVSGKKAVTVPAGFQIQSKAGPGKEPQVFEVDVDTVASLPDQAGVDPPPDPKLFVEEDGLSTLLLAGTVTSLAADDELLLRHRNWDGTGSHALLVKVKETRKETSPRGTKNTRVVLSADHALDEMSSDWVLLRATQSAGLFFTAETPIIDIRQVDKSTDVSNDVLFSTAVATTAAVQTTHFSSLLSGVVGALAFEFGNHFDAFDAGGLIGGAIVGERFSLSTGHEIHLDSIREPIDPGDALVLKRSGAPAEIFLVKSHARAIWYQNADETTPSKKPTPTEEEPNLIPIPVVHSVITINVSLDTTEIEKWNGARAEVKVEYGWTEAGTIIGTPSTQYQPRQTTATLLPADTAATTLASTTVAMLVDANGLGTDARVTRADRTAVALEGLDTSAEPLAAPLELLTNLVNVSRGKTVSNEILGSGDAAVSGQEFTLKKSPLTYRQSGDGYSSTLRILVAGVEWKEVASFYAQPADAKVFVTKEDAGQKTHVLFGDGISGARLPTGTGNVVASYRYGSGAALPDAGTLTVILSPRPGVRAIRNPISPFGGADPDDPEKVRRYAPRSVFTFGRAVSADDYEVIAASAPGVSRARAEWTFDSKQQRALLKVYVGDDNAAVDSARAAIAGSRDPNRPVDIVPAKAVACDLDLTLLVSSDRDETTVAAAARVAIEDADAGLLGKNVVVIGKTLYDSQIYRACLAVDGVVAVRSIAFRTDVEQTLLSVPETRVSAQQTRVSALQAGPRHHPGPDGFFALRTLNITTEQA